MADPAAKSCPYCGELIDAQTLARFAPAHDNAPPRDGDLSVCFYCAGLLQRNAGRWLQLPAEIFNKLEPGIRDELIQAAQAVRIFRRMRG